MNHMYYLTLFEVECPVDALLVNMGKEVEVS